MTDQSKRIAAMNDQFRQTGVGGQVFMTRGIAALPAETQAFIVARVRQFEDFTPDNDPYGEHDFGAIDVKGVGQVFWKIDYYAPDMSHGSEDPTDLSITVRVLTIMLAEEY